jgi:hypothetical protein
MTKDVLSGVEKVEMAVADLVEKLELMKESLGITNCKFCDGLMFVNPDDPFCETCSKEMDTEDSLKSTFDVGGK